MDPQGIEWRNPDHNRQLWPDCAEFIAKGLLNLAIVHKLGILGLLRSVSQSEIYYLQEPLSLAHRLSESELFAVHNILHAEQVSAVSRPRIDVMPVPGYMHKFSVSPKCREWVSSAVVSYPQ
jgi:hypothetical protein